jgi:hypothetical protein
LTGVTPKRAALLALALLSFAGPLVERWVTGEVEPFGRYELAVTLISIPFLFWWYHVDKREHGYQAGPLMNGGVLALAIVALPIYFIRSRGWQRGMVTTLLAAAFFGLTLVLGELGERVGAFFAR